MASVFKRPKRVAQLGRNGFDMSQRRIFSSPCGMLLPTYSDFANPGDKYKLNSRTFVRTQPLQSSAFVRFKAHVDWFFVPITQLYSLWNEFYNMTNDVMSSIFSSTPNLSLPLAPNNSVSAPLNVGSWALTSSESGESGLSVASLKVDEFGVPLAFNARRLYDMLYGHVPMVGSDFFSVNVLPLMAYHKIFHSHYRNTDYTPNEPGSYSLDKYYDVSEIPLTVLPSLLKIHYRPWRKDMFTSIQPAPVFGDGFESYFAKIPQVSSSVGYFNPESSGLSDSYAQISQVSGGDISYPQSAVGSRLSLNSSVPSLNASSIRSIFALDKLLRITAQTGSHYEEQTLAHFGFKMPQGVANEAYYLGEQVTDININEVVATATTGSKEAGGVIGDIAGKGFGYTGNSKDIEFTCPSHGYIMAIYSIEPIADYRYEGDETAKYKFSFDFYHPEFDGIGMQPYGYSSPSSSTQPYSIPGWQYRYMQHKAKLDSIQESIYGTSFDSWALTREAAYDVPSVTPGGAVNDGKVFSLPLVGRFYIFPQYTNGVFLGSFPSYNEPSLAAGGTGNYTFRYGDVAPIGGQWMLDYLNAQRVYSLDGFLNVVDHNVFKTSCMSVYSLPNM